MSKNNNEIRQTTIRRLQGFARARLHPSCVVEERRSPEHHYALLLKGQVVATRPTLLLLHHDVERRVQLSGPEGWRAIIAPLFAILPEGAAELSSELSMFLAV
jgi:hypothetical protein